ncbi:MAG TPA: long-chain fatty acid--CoA ligase [Actinocrinis sp.]|nr:long-chain fatty acid--CoA ligase [Actinocrinis sp.]
MLNDASAGSAFPAFPTSGPTPGWIDPVLLAGSDDEPCLRLDRPIDRAELRALVAEQEQRLTGAGLGPGGTATLLLPPSLGFITALLAVWRIGAQVSLLDHRLTRAEVDRALDRLAPQALVEAAGQVSTGLRGFADVRTSAVARPQGVAASSAHALIQLSSGSTGPSKVIARTAEDLVFELERYARLPQFPARGHRVVLLSSMVHVLGLVGGLLQALHAGAELVLPERMTAAGILSAIASGSAPTTVIGVPFHAELLTGVAEPPPLPALTRMIVAGELTRPGLPEAFTARYGVPLGSMYGMTELGVIATDLTGALRPELEPTNRLELHVRDGELHIRMPQSPYLGATDPARWSDGWLHTRDAARFDAGTGRLTILGRRDSQVSIGGLKVDLTEVEQTLGLAKGVTGAVLVFEAGAIEAYVTLDEGVTAEEVRAELATQVASFKMPRHLRVLTQLPRTSTGKVLRDPTALRRAAAEAEAALTVPEVGARSDAQAVSEL